MKTIVRFAFVSAISAAAAASGALLTRGAADHFRRPAKMDSVQLTLPDGSVGITLRATREGRLVIEDGDRRAFIDMRDRETDRLRVLHIGIADASMALASADDRARFRVSVRGATNPNVDLIAGEDDAAFRIDSGRRTLQGSARRSGTVQMLAARRGGDGSIQPWFDLSGGPSESVLGLLQQRNGESRSQAVMAVSHQGSATLQGKSDDSEFSLSSYSERGSDATFKCPELTTSVGVHAGRGTAGLETASTTGQKISATVGSSARFQAASRAPDGTDTTVAIGSKQGTAGLVFALDDVPWAALHLSPPAEEELRTLVMGTLDDESNPVNQIVFDAKGRLAGTLVERSR